MTTETLKRRQDTQDQTSTQGAEFSMATNRELYLHSVDLSGEAFPYRKGLESGTPHSLDALNKRLEADWRSMRGFLGVKDVEDIYALAKDPDRLDATRSRAEGLMASQYGLEKTEFQDRIGEYAELADKVATYASRDLPARFQEQGLESGIKQIDHPVDLLVAAYTAPDRLDRFRALRKFRLIQNAAKVEQHERQAGTREAFNKFDAFIQNDVFTPIGEEGPELRFLVSTHDLDSERFDTLTTNIYTKEQLEENGIFDQDGGLTLQPGQKILPLQRRTFETEDGEEVSAYIPITELNKLTREKPREKIMLKVERKGESVARAVDDQVGMMVIFDKGEDILKFEDHLVATAADKGSALEFEDLEDTLSGGEHVVRSEGSSADLQQRKTHLRMFGVRPELIEYTPKAAADNIYGRNSHKRYELKRLLNRVIRRYYPPARYEYDFDEVAADTMKYVEAEIRHPYQVNGHPSTANSRQVRQELVGAIN
jgi:hypothetical protein